MIHIIKIMHYEQFRISVCIWVGWWLMCVHIFLHLYNKISNRKHNLYQNNIVENTEPFFPGKLQFKGQGVNISYINVGLINCIIYLFQLE